MAYYKPIKPLQQGEDYIYPLTTADQVIKSDGTRLDAGDGVEADKLVTARSIALTGDVTGSGTFDGSSDLDITTTIPDRYRIYTEEIPDGADLNDYKTPGFYRSEYAANTTSNAPFSSGAFELEVKSIRQATDSYCSQLIRYANSTKLYIRYYDSYNSTWSAWDGTTLDGHTHTNVRYTVYGVDGSVLTFATNAPYGFTPFSTSASTTDLPSGYYNYSSGWVYKRTDAMYTVSIQNYRNGSIVTNCYSSGAWQGWTTILSDGQNISPSYIDVAANQYYPDYGIHMHNSDLIGLNGIYFNDAVDSATEGINFYRSTTTWDRLYAYNGVLYFAPNQETATFPGTRYTVYHSGGDTIPVSKGGTGATTAANARANLGAAASTSPAISGYITLTNNSVTTQIGSQNSAFCHFTGAPKYYFDNSLYVKGEVYAGSSYNSLLYGAHHMGWKRVTLTFSSGVATVACTGVTATSVILVTRAGTYTDTSGSYGFLGAAAATSGTVKVFTGAGVTNPSSWTVNIWWSK